MEINNLPDNIPVYTFIVVRKIKGVYWFHSAYDSCAEAKKVAREIHGRALQKMSY